MPTTKRLRFISDLSHGWLEVSAMDVLLSGITVSEFSYVDEVRGLVYLEEDVDCPAYLAATRIVFCPLHIEYLSTSEFPGKMSTPNRPIRRLTTVVGGRS